MPMLTAMSAVMANHSSVWPARRAAPVTPRRLAMLAMIAVRTSGTTRVRSSDDERAADRGEGAGQPVGAAVGDGAHLAGDQAEDDAEHEAGEDLGGERDLLETCEHEGAPGRWTDGRTGGAGRRRCQRVGQRSLEVRSRST